MDISLQLLLLIKIDIRKAVAANQDWHEKGEERFKHESSRWHSICSAGDGEELKQGERKMIHMILVGQKAGEMAKAVYVMGESLFPPLSLEPAFAETFRIFSKLEVVTNEDRDKFISMLKETGRAYGNPIVKPDSGAYLGFAGHAY